MVDLQWVCANLLTGKLICDLPDIEVGSQPLAVTIGQLEATQVVLNVESSTNPDWFAGTQPGGSVLVAWTGDPASPTVVGGWIVQQRFRSASNAVQLGLVTYEAYLDACYIGDYTATGINQDTILASLMAYAGGPTRPAVILNQLTPSTAVQSVTYAKTSQVSVYSGLQALSAVAGGPEWTADWVWNVAAGTIVPRLNYGVRVGSPVLAGAQPNVTFELDDLMGNSGFTEDYSQGRGANDVIAFGGASPASTTSAIAYAEASAVDTKGRPTWTYAYQPNANVTDPAILATYSSAAVTQMQDGSQPLVLTILHGLTGKTFGQDWGLGDSIGWYLDGLTFPVPVSGVSRCIGYRADTTTITPILQGTSLA